MSDFWSCTNDSILPAANDIPKRNNSKNKREEGKGGLIIILKGGFYDLMMMCGKNTCAKTSDIMTLTESITLKHGYSR